MMMQAVATLPFDHVRVENELFTVAQFLALPMGKRVAAIIGKRVTFYDGQRAVDLSTALQQLRQHVQARPNEAPGANK